MSGGGGNPPRTGAARTGAGPRRRRYAPPRPDAARAAAFEALREVDASGAYANLALPAIVRAHRLDTRDAALTTELVYGTLRHAGTYEVIAAACTDRPLEDIDPGVLDIVGMGAHQIFATRIPPHAAVSATVEVARARLGDGRARFANAVLRRMSERSLDDWLAEVAPDAAEDPAGHLGVVHSHPRWIVDALWDAHGGSADEVAAVLAADNERPLVTLAARPGRGDVAELVALGARPGRYSPYAAILPGGDPAHLAPVAEGRAGVQDEGSQLAALALARAPIDGPDARWLDTCAGPGGKAALLAGLAAERGAALLAAELRPHRARLVQAALRGGPGHHTVVIADATVPPWPDAVFDRVLVDAPCTGLGALRRRPEARWRHTPEDVAALGVLQRDLLDHAAAALRPGGVVAYVTCSPHLAETRMVVADVTRRRGDVRPVDVRPLLAGVPGLGDGPHVQLWPHVHGTDGMFIALLQRT